MNNYLYDDLQDNAHDFPAPTDEEIRAMAELLSDYEIQEPLPF